MIFKDVVRKLFNPEILGLRGHYVVCECVINDIRLQKGQTKKQFNILSNFGIFLTVFFHKPETLYFTSPALTVMKATPFYFCSG